MAKVKYGSQPIAKKRIKRKGGHSKKKTQNSPMSKNYRKKYRGQGR